jgi:biopolymer transport protein ExbD
MRASTTSLPKNSELNVTPMLDVMLVLLVIFMAASVAMHHTIDVSLPQPCADLCDGPDPITLEVLPGPIYRLNGTTIAAAMLARTIHDMYVDRPEKVMYVAGQPGVTYEAVVDAVDVARSNGVRVIGIAPKLTATTQRFFHAR